MAASVGGKVMEEAAAIQPRQGSGKVFSVSRLLTRDSTASAAPSFRVYYGVASAGAVPFLWESQPGTPKKDAAFDAAMPPLTPPPSYYASAKEGGRDGKAGRKGGGGILGSILPRLAMARRRTRPTSGSPPTSSSSFSSASTSSSSSSSTLSSILGTQSPACSSMRGGGSSSRMRAPSSCSSMRGAGSSRMHTSSSSSFSDEDDTAVACFRVRAESFRALKGCRVAVTVRSALASVGGNHHAPAVQAQRV